MALSFSHVSRIFWLVLVLLVLVNQAKAEVYDPSAMDSLQVVELEQLEGELEKIDSFSHRFVAYKELFKKYSTNEGFPIAANLVYTVLDDIRNEVNQDEYLSYVEDLESVPALEKLDPINRNHLCYLIGRMLAFNGEINAAEARLLRVAETNAEEVAISTITVTHYMLGFCAYYTDQLDRAAYHTRLAAEGYLQQGDNTGALEAYDGVSTTFFKMGKVDSALHYARKGLVFIDDVGMKQGSNLYLNYSEALMADGKVDSAFYYATEASEYLESQGIPSGVARAQYALANLNKLAGRTNRAANHYLRCIENFKQSREPYHIVSAMDSLVLIYRDNRNFESAYSLATVSSMLKDSLRQERIKADADQRVAEFERDILAKELESSKRERAYAQAVIAKSKYERVATFGIFGCLLLLVGFVYYRASTRKSLATRLQAEVNKQTANIKEHSKKLELQAQRLKESNAELERFAYIASHDLKTPLRNVTSFLGLIERRLPPEPKAMVAEYLNIALQNARQMHHLVTDVLEFSRLNADVDELSEQVKISEVVEQIRIGMKVDLQERNARVECIGDDELLLPKGSLELVLGNLVGNAIKYNESVRPLARVLVTDMGERVRIAVSDNGIGIDPEYHSRVFEVFRRLHTSDKYSGTGVGLAACRKVLLRLGGDIMLDSKDGEGSTFIVDIPRDCMDKLRTESDVEVQHA